MSKQQLLIFLLLIVIVPIGFYTKYYSGPGEDWVANSMGGLIYEVFWCLIFALIFPSLHPIKIAAGVFVITCIIEFLQLWHPPFLELIRSNLIGRTILGNSFNWMDFPYYALGCVLGWSTLVVIRKAIKPMDHTSDQQ